jgi:hypothetical protein
MQEKRVIGSSMESLDYSVMYKINGENLEFEGICENLEHKDIPECQWTVVCSDPENVVVKFHNGD